MFQRQDRTPEKDSNEINISNLHDKEFKAMVIKRKIKNTLLNLEKNRGTQREFLSFLFFHGCTKSIWKFPG